MGKLSKQQILDVVDLKSEDVEVPEWGGSVTVREFSAADRDAYVSQTTRIGASGAHEVVLDGMQTKLVAMCIVDENGERMFSDLEVAALGRKSSVAIERVAAVAGRLNGLTGDATEQMRGNSEAGQSGDSPSA